ncbi:MAG: aminodeoxychorismate/anthranilate synthase component II [Gemmatimonadales bacterium]|jgi:anthranilate synthase/aminodeoxychorismate synthase-like glutamine amidotransferase
MIDNYDSFTYNLVQLFGMLGVSMTVRRNDEIAVDDIARLAPRAIVISPGPCTPDEAGISLQTIERYLGSIPILGVCLGHQAIAQALGGHIVRAERVVHGKTSVIFHNASGIFAGIPNPFEATRYHSLIADAETLPKELCVTAKTWEDEVMAVQHKALLCTGVQFHPESVLSVDGPAMMKNFAALVNEFWDATE